MPKTLFDSEGKEVQVPDDQEFAAMKAAAQSAAESKAKLESYEKDDKYQNVRKLAESRDRLAESLKKLGKNVDVESGNVTDPQSQGISVDEVKNAARQTSEQFFIEQALENAKTELDDNDRKIFDKMYQKAAFGEEVNPRTISKIIADTKSMAFGEQVKEAPRSTASRSLFRSRFGGIPEMAVGDDKPLTPLQEDFIRRNGGDRAFPTKPRKHS